jgi:Zn-dependent protease with chaperone function
MDFFAHQDRTRTNSLYLIILFIIAVILVTISVYFALHLAFYCTMFLLNLPEPIPFDYVWIDWKIFFIITFITFAIIIQACVIKSVNLANGGSSIAEKLGGRLLIPAPGDSQERILRNVVEEMAVAAGVPAPQIYLLDKEKSINAFTAGHKPSNAVVAVTRGSLNKLNREELQGMVAHEFSHILNGDMRLNIRLIGYLFGITLISKIGYWIWRAVDDARGKGSLLLIGATALIAVGSIGAFFARIIQCAVSRQREFLADASAVQFTRNPEGVSGVLKKIGRYDSGSGIRSRNAPEVCHMFFSMAIQSMLATHPPLDERIRRIEPWFKGKMTEFGFLRYEADTDASWKKFDSAVSKMTMNLKHAGGHVGRPASRHVSYASDMLAELSHKIKNELESILGATAVACALLLSRAPEERKHQTRALKKYAPPEVYNHILCLETEVQKIAPIFYLPILELSIPTLRCMSPSQFAALQRYLQALIEADGKLTLFEFALKKMITYHLGSNYRSTAAERTITTWKQLMPHLANLLSVLATADHEKTADSRGAFDAGVEKLKAAGVVQKASFSEQVSFNLVDTALDHLARAAPAFKRTVYDALCACVLFDEQVTIQEAELLRTVASIMDIPVPPFIQSTVKTVFPHGYQ